MDILKKILWSALLFLPFSCYEEEEPIDTECGKDTFDIDMDGMNFRDDYEFKPAGLAVSDSVVTFSLYGRVERRWNHDDWKDKPQYSDYHSHENDYRALSISFPLKQRKMDDFTDVVSLSHTSIDFGKDSVLVTLEVNDVKDTLDVTSGLLRFNCADLLGIDGHRDFVVLAGTLSFSYYDDNAKDSTNIAAKKDFYNRKSVGGNFDVRIGRSNFDKKN